MVLILENKDEYDQYTNINILNINSQSKDKNEDCLNYHKFFRKYGIKIDDDEQLFDASIALLKHENNKIENASLNEIKKAIVEINWFRDIAFDKFCQRQDAIKAIKEKEKKKELAQRNTMNVNRSNSCGPNCVML